MRSAAMGTLLAFVVGAALGECAGVARGRGTAGTLAGRRDSLSGLWAAGEGRPHPIPRPG